MIKRNALKFVFKVIIMFNLGSVLFWGSIDYDMTDYDFQVKKNCKYML